MDKLIYNYHTHTARCGHAIGEDEQYVQEAIKLGIKRLGFSDHVILPKGFDQEGIRGNPNRLEDYLESIKYLKEKYKNDIEILIGFEAEYFPQMEEYYKSLLRDKIDFLILGQHCYLKDNYFQWYFHQDSPIEDIKRYVDDVIAGIKSGLFKYVCHPDLFMSSQGNWNMELEQESRRLLKTCEEYDIPVELNICGMRRRNYDEEHYSYPNANFYKLIKDYHIRIVLGIDAHDPKHFSQNEVDKGLRFAEKYNIELIEDYYL